MKIGFIGAGKVGSGFGIYLGSKGFDVVGYFDTNIEASEMASKNAGGVRFENVDDLLRASDLIFITTPDDFIKTVCDQIVKSLSFKQNAMVAHMSGAADCSLLESARSKGAEVFSLHPLQAFADAEKVSKQLKGTYFGLETTTEVSHKLEAFMLKLGNPYFRLESGQKANYHMAAVVVSNYMTTLMEFGLSLFEKAGIDRSQGFEALLPLIQGALQNIQSYGPAKALTGPIARGDATTIEKHLEAFKMNDVGEDFYRFMACETLKLAEKEKLKDQDKIRKIHQILEE